MSVPSQSSSAGSFQSRMDAIRPFGLPVVTVGFVIVVVAWASGSPVSDTKTPSAIPDDLANVVARVDSQLEQRWKNATLREHSEKSESEPSLIPSPVTPAEPADERQVLRRLSLALLGTVPSLEEIRLFDADAEPNRLTRWTLRYLNDSRFPDYFAERLARGFVSTEGGTFIVYRRDRFVDWLRDQLQKNVPYDNIVREMIASDGLWTGDPATNFMTAAYQDKKFNVNKITSRSVRAFLGQRIDCAQCHDAIFADWKQTQFEGLAAFFGQTRLNVFGIHDEKTDSDGEPLEYVIEDRDTLEERTVKPEVPFLAELLPEEGTRREQLAAWITHPKNRRFERATANRVWALMFGRQYTYPHYPVDDLPDPEDSDTKCDTKVLDILGEDFREHGYDLRRLILAITSTRAFRMSSSHPIDRLVETPEKQLLVDELIDHHEHNWAIFPLSRLRPEQVIGSMIQTSSARTIDQNSHLFVRLVRYFRARNFVEEYGDMGGEELIEQAGTIPQALLRMNGKLPEEMLKASPFSLSGRINLAGGSDRNCVEVGFLVGLCRLPNEEEMENWLPRLQSANSGDDRNQILEDLYWSIYNSPDFSWNH